MRRVTTVAMTVGVTLVLVAQAMGDEGAFGGGHRAFPTIVSKISSGLIFVAPLEGLRPRTISPAKADRVGLHEAKPGDEVTLIVDEGNVLMDAHKSGIPASGHRMVTGNLNYADAFWGEVKVSTPGGIERFDVDTLTGSKLSIMQEGFPVVLELDEDNTVIDIHRTH
ncbi:MAG: hypothetical protein ACRD1T_06055 [Acidimicrobiia bacterium]